MRIPTKLLATGVACALAVVVCGTAATVVVAADVAGRSGSPQWNRPFAHRSDATTSRSVLQPDSAAWTYAGNFNLQILIEQESDATSHAAENIAGDRAVQPSLRIASLSAITLGGCRNLPELVFGFSEKRRDAMRRAVANIQDIAGGTDPGARQRRLLEHALELQEAPEVNSRQTIPGSIVLMRNFSWIIPPGVRARTVFCLQQGF